MIELATLGGSSIRHDGSEFTGLSAHKQEVALLVYFAAGNPVPRETGCSYSPQTVLPCARRTVGRLVGVQR
jgi:hypothetical protein